MNDCCCITKPDRPIIECLACLEAEHDKCRDKR